MDITKSGVAALNRQSEDRPDRAAREAALCRSMPRLQIGHFVLYQTVSFGECHRALQKKADAVFTGDLRLKFAETWGDIAALTGRPGNSP